MTKITSKKHASTCVDISEVKELLKEISRLKAENEFLKRQINCVNDHPEIKPVYCCWTADSLAMQGNKKLVQELRAEYRELKTQTISECPECKRRGKLLEKLQAENEKLSEEIAELTVNKNN